ncbi:MAG: transmembrane 220 family protein [Kiloniellales bacterium]
MKSLPVHRVLDALRNRCIFATGHVGSPHSFLLAAAGVGPRLTFDPTFGLSSHLFTSRRKSRKVEYPMSAKALLQSINAFLCVLLIAFAAVQYNDPDFYFWVPVYLLPAALAGLTVYRPQRLLTPPFNAVLLACVVAGIVGTLWIWPTEEGFWHREVWWHSETAREGMGFMIVAVALLVVALSAWSTRRGGRPPTASGQGFRAR